MLVVLHPYFPAESMEARFSLETLDLYLEFLKFNTDSAFQSLSYQFLSLTSMRSSAQLLDFIGTFLELLCAWTRGPHTGNPVLVVVELTQLGTH